MTGRPVHETIIRDEGRLGYRVDIDKYKKHHPHHQPANQAG